MKTVILACAIFVIFTNLLFTRCHPTKAGSQDKQELVQTGTDKEPFAQGVKWAEKGDYDRAIVSFSRAIEDNPQDAEAYRNRGLAWKLKGDYEKALTDFTTAIEMDPHNPSVYNSIAWLLATCPDDKYRDGKKAIRWIQKVVDLDPDNVISLDTLAAAYAEAGRFPDAIRTQRKVILLTKKQGKKRQLPTFVERLNSYKAHRPWRE